MSSDYAVRFKNVSVLYDRMNTALSGIECDILKGAFLGVLGSNGAGKSTFLKCINGLVSPSFGSIESLGYQVKRHYLYKLRKDIGYVSQEQKVDSRIPITVIESVLVGCFGRLGLFCSPGEKQRREAEAILEQIGILSLSNKPLGHLSGGERQKVAIARALMQQPKILLLDEPSKSLDISSQVELRTLIGKLHNELGTTTILVTHNLNLLPNECDKVLFLQGGRVFWEGNKTELLNMEHLVKLYKTKVWISTQDGRTNVCF